ADRPAEPRHLHSGRKHDEHRRARRPERNQDLTCKLSPGTSLKTSPWRSTTSSPSRIRSRCASPTCTSGSPSSTISPTIHRSRTKASSKPSRWHGSRSGRKTRNNATLVDSCSKSRTFYAEVENSQGRGQALQEDRHGQGGSRTCVCAPYPDVQSQEAQAQAG